MLDIIQKNNREITQSHGGENPENLPSGACLHAKTITYGIMLKWTRYSLQKPRTNFKDESIFHHVSSGHRTIFKMDAT